MTEISEAAKAKATTMMNVDEYVTRDNIASFIQQVSDAAKVVAHHYDRPSSISLAHAHLAPFILPEPVDPLDTIVEDLADNAGWRPFERTPSLKEAKRVLRLAVERGKEIGIEEATRNIRVQS